MKKVMFFVLILLSIQISLSQSNVDELQNQKSVAFAAVLSFILPGMGELYVGNYQTGKYFSSIECALWLSYYSLDSYGKWIRDDARRFAALQGGVNPAGQNSQFYVNIGNYIDVYHYNERKLQERQITKLYDPNSIYYWKWNTDDDRNKYKNLRIASDRALNNRYFLLASIFVNHLISAINAGRNAAAYNKRIESSSTIHFETKLLGSTYKPDGILIKISKTF